MDKPMKVLERGKKAVYTTLGASNHSKCEREQNDFYATDPKALELLLELETFSPRVWECACGQGHLSECLKKHGYNVFSTDLIDRGYGQRCDFLDNLETLQYQDFDGDIITNPPYKYATEFVEKALDIVGDGHKVAMFLRLQFLEGQRRRKLFDAAPPQSLCAEQKIKMCTRWRF